ncbi:MAG: hypothetical protein IPJ77_05795 [Planctomycetes bacterium]|nr:hypothetical protein [Planctomycetota bacterium]
MRPGELPQTFQSLACTATDRSLDVYLSSLLEGLKRFDARDSLNADEVAWLIERGFRGSVALEEKVRRYSTLAAQKEKALEKTIQGFFRNGRMDLERMMAYRREELLGADLHSVSEVVALQISEIQAFREQGIWRPLAHDGHTTELRGWVNLSPRSYVEAGHRGAIELHDAEAWPDTVVEWGWLLAFVRCGKVYE